jgi:subtilisin-like proprotein convertase family protein
MVVYWNFESPTCGQHGGGSLADNQTGAYFRASSSASDFCLVELDEDPDPASNVYFAGWDKSGTTPANVTAIHHPSVDEKSISFDYDSQTVTSYLGTSTPGDGTHWRIGAWDDGTTEGGSSGSGIWNENHHIVGQLHGGYASCTSITSDWYGRLSVSWNGGGTSSTRLSTWLDPGNTGAVTLDGAYPAPFVRLASFGGQDYCSAGGAGDLNAVWEPGEQIIIPVDVTASGGAFTNVSGTLTCTSPGVTMLDGSATWPDIAQNGTATTDAPHFGIAIDPAVPCGSVLDFEVSVTTNEGGPFVHAFQHEVGQSLVPAGLPASIPDNSTGGVTNTLTVADDVSLIDVDVRVQISHSWVGDLKLELRSPSGTTVTLLDRPGVPGSTYGCSDDDMDVTFDDASGTVLESYCNSSTPWYVGVAAPVGALSAFSGESTAGDWQLIVSDHATGDTGSITGWELITKPAISGTCIACAGGTAAPEVAAATTFGLAPVRPNPFGATAELAFALDRPGRTRLEVIDVAGRSVTTIVDRNLPAGRHAYAWDGRDARGSAVAAGVYFVRLTSGDHTDLERVIRLR